MKATLGRGHESTNIRMTFLEMAQGRKGGAGGNGGET